jgi:hypothetical protein
VRQRPAAGAEQHRRRQRLAGALDRPRARLERGHGQIVRPARRAPLAHDAVDGEQFADGGHRDRGGLRPHDEQALRAARVVVLRAGR